jgi:hypothetical protein
VSLRLHTVFCRFETQSAHKARSFVRLDASRDDPFLNQNYIPLISSHTSVLPFTGSFAGATLDSAMGIASPDLQ